MSTHSTAAAPSRFPPSCHAQLPMGSCHRNVPQGKLCSVAGLPCLCSGNWLSCVCLLHSVCAVVVNLLPELLLYIMGVMHVRNEGKPLQIPENTCRWEKPPLRWLTYTPEVWECQGNRSLHGTQREGSSPSPQRALLHVLNKWMGIHTCVDADAQIWLCSCSLKQDLLKCKDGLALFILMQGLRWRSIFGDRPCIWLRAN